MLYGYSHISKTGGTTLLTILRSSFGAAHCDIEPWLSKHHSFTFDHQDLAKLYRIYPALKSVNGHHFHPYHSYEDITPVRYYTYIREPLSRCLSEYQYQTSQRGKNWSLDDYINGSGSNAQCRFLSGAEDSDAAIGIVKQKNIVCGLTERFDESLLLLNKLVFSGTLNCNYQRQKSAPNQSIRNAISNDEEAIHRIKEHNSEDYKLYHFVKDSLYPQQQTQYGDSLPTDLANFRASLTQQDFNHLNIMTNRVYRNLIYKPSLTIYRLLNQSKKKQLL